jgi:hypothetical protein
MSDTGHNLKHTCDYVQAGLVLPCLKLYCLVTPRFRLRDLIGSEIMTSPLQREALLELLRDAPG